MSEVPLHFLSIAELGSQFRNGSLSPLELTKYFLTRIEKLDPHLNAFRLLTPEIALAAAQAAGEQLKNGIDLGPLHGIPYAAKDLYDVKGLPTTAGTRLLADNIAAEDCTVIRSLNQAGMVLLGKTNTVQFAYGGAGINHDHGTPHNPWHQTHHVPGGSSSGSAVAVAAGLAPMALGTDTGGSVRIPSSLCGLSGLKTTVGRISRAGVYPLSHSLDSVGPLCRTAEDAALVFQALQSTDPDDPATKGVEPVNMRDILSDGIKGMRVAFPEKVFWDGAHPEVVKQVRETAKIFEVLGAHVESILFKEAEEAVRLNDRGLVIAAEAYHANKKWVEEHFDELDPIVAHRIIKGKDISAPEYIHMTREWERLRAETARTLSEVDLLLCPATAIPAEPLEQVDQSPETYSERNLYYLRNTAIGNILNFCGLSVPCGHTAEGLPIGLMIYGKPFQEEKVLRAGYAYQQATWFHTKTPDLSWTGDA